MRVNDAANRSKFKFSLVTFHHDGFFPDTGKKRPMTERKAVRSTGINLQKQAKKFLLKLGYQTNLNTIGADTRIF